MSIRNRGSSAAPSARYEASIIRTVSTWTLTVSLLGMQSSVLGICCDPKRHATIRYMRLCTTNWPFARHASTPALSSSHLSSGSANTPAVGCLEGRAVEGLPPSGRQPSSCTVRLSRCRDCHATMMPERLGSSRRCPAGAAGPVAGCSACYQTCAGWPSPCGTPRR